MKKIITYGTFDHLHRGHINIFKKAKEEFKGQNVHLIVYVSNDEFNKMKHKECDQSFEIRKKAVEANKYVDEVKEEYDWSQKPSDIDKEKANLFVMGDDWKGKFDNLPCKVKYFKRTPGISSTKIRKQKQN